jgi:hypothetical protein
MMRWARAALTAALKDTMARILAGLSIEAESG